MRSFAACRFGSWWSKTVYGAEFQSRLHGHLADLDIRHVYIRPRTPHLNGKVERSHRVDDQESYQLLDRDGITDDGQTPYERLIAKMRPGNDTGVLGTYTGTLAERANCRDANW